MQLYLEVFFFYYYFSVVPKNHKDDKYMCISGLQEV